MVLVRNNTARIYNIQALGEKGRVIRLRLDPVVNSVPDNVWDHCKKDAYVKRLLAAGKLTVIDELDHNPVSESEKPVAANVQQLDYATDDDSDLDLDCETGEDVSKNKKSKKSKK